MTIPKRSTPIAPPGDDGAPAPTSAGIPAAAASPVGCSNLKLRRLTRRVSRDFDFWVGASGLKTTQYSLLSTVARLGAARPGDLADALDMDASTLTRNLQPLVARGWVSIGPGDDGRSRQVVVTPAGHAKRAEARLDWMRAQQAFTARLGAERVGRLHALIDECLDVLDRQATAPGPSVAKSPRCKPSK